jgi:hypothetical protein
MHDSYAEWFDGADLEESGWRKFERKNYFLILGKDVDIK